MTSFVHVDQPTVHPGVRRAEVLFGQIQAARAGANGARPLIALLIIAIAAAVLVVTDSLVSNWNEGGLLAVWTVFCLAAIALFALFAGSVRESSIGAALRAASQRRAAARADARFLATAQSDPRVMQELQAAMWRQQEQGTVDAADVAKIDGLAHMSARSQEVRMPTLYEAMRRMNSSRYY
jgi:high-affinity K+ transport system ATPase subunit B